LTGCAAPTVTSNGSTTSTVARPEATDPTAADPTAVPNADGQVGSATNDGPAPSTSSQHDEAFQQPRPAELTMTCQTPVFPGDTARFPATYWWIPGGTSVEIWYGDGRSYRTHRDEWLDSAFEHTYEQAGVYEVTAVISLSDGGTASASCWQEVLPQPAMPYPSQTPELSGADGWTPSGSPALCADGTLTHSAGSQGACSWHGGLAD
jgi:hypothetical protein